MSDQEGPSRKQQRISRACDRCRRRKSKCDGRQPICSICETTQSQCVYSASSRKRGLPTGFVRSLEIALGLLLDGCSEAEGKARLLVRSHQSSNTAFEDAAVDTWRKSGLAQDMTLLLSDPDELLSDDWDSNIRATTLPLTDIKYDGDAEPCPSDEVRDTGGLEVSTQNLPNRQPEGSIVTARSHLLNCLEVPMPADTSDLLDFYFAYTHSWFPVVERSEILRAFHTKQRFSEAQVHDIGRHMCLSSIVAYTLVSRGGHQSGVTYPEGKDIQAQIQLRIATDDRNMELGHVQALLIIVLLRIGRGQVHAAWILVGQVVRMMLIMAEQQITVPARFNHVMHGCMFLDAFVSALLDKTSCMSTVGQLELHQVDESGIEEWDTWLPLPQFPSEYSRTIPRRPIRALSTFNALREPMKVLTHVLHSKSMGASPQDFTRNLHKWQGDLEKHHHLHTADLMNPSALFFHLIKNFVLLTMLRWTEVSDPEASRACCSTVTSTLNLLEQYIRLTGVPGSSPLLIGLAFQMHSCLQNPCLIIDATTRSTSDSHTSEILTTLKNHWHRAAVYQQQNSASRQHSNFDSYVLVSNTPWHREGTGNPNASTTTRPTPSSELESAIDQHAQTGVSELVGAPEARPIHQNQTETSHSSALDVDVNDKDDNDFDALFEEMMAFAPVRRSVPDSTFAHNMGFMDDQFDQDFWDSLNKSTVFTDNIEPSTNVDDNHPI